MQHFNPVSVSVGGELGTGFMLEGGEEVLHRGGINSTLSQPGMVTTGLAPRLLCLCGTWPVVPKGRWLEGAGRQLYCHGAGVVLQHVNSHCASAREVLDYSHWEWTSFLLEILSRKAEELATWICWENSQNRKRLFLPVGAKQFRGPVVCTGMGLAGWALSPELQPWMSRALQCQAGRGRQCSSRPSLCLLGQRSRERALEGDWAVMLT